MHPELERHVSHIEGLTSQHLSLLKDMLLADAGKMYPLDILAAATVKRSMSPTLFETKIIYVQLHCSDFN
jgi:hypothetical protein